MQGAVVNSSLAIDDTTDFKATGWALMRGKFTQRCLATHHHDFVSGSLTGRNQIGVKIYFSVKILGEVVGYGIWEDSILHASKRNGGGPNCGAYAGQIYMLPSFTFTTVFFLEILSASNSAIVIVSLSLISIAQVV